MYEASSNSISGINHASTIAANGAGEQMDVARVSREMGNLQKRIAENRELVSSLEQRLSAVLRPAATQIAGNEGKDPRDAVSPLASDLESFSRSIGVQNDQLDNILQRLEV